MKKVPQGLGFALVFDAAWFLNVAKCLNGHYIN